MSKQKRKEPDPGSESPKGVVSQDPEMKAFNDGLRLILSVSKEDLQKREAESKPRVK